MTTVQPADESESHSVQPCKPARDNLDRERRSEHVKRRRARLAIENRGIDLLTRLYMGGLPQEVAEAIAFSPVCEPYSSGRFARTFAYDPQLLAHDCDPVALLCAQNFTDVQWTVFVREEDGAQRWRCSFLWGDN